jgi:hypothetical protein
VVSLDKGIQAYIFKAWWLSKARHDSRQAQASNWEVGRMGPGSHQYAEAQNILYSTAPLASTLFPIPSLLREKESKKEN